MSGMKYYWLAIHPGHHENRVTSLELVATMAARLPPLGQDDFESQIQFPSLIEHEDNHFHDAMDYTSMDDAFDQLGGLDNLDKVDNTELVNDAQDSNPSAVEETQIVTLEIDTQPESNRSLVKETQYIPLEVDTQADTQAFDQSDTRTAMPGPEKATTETTDDDHQDEVSLIDVNAYAKPRPISAGPVNSGHPAAGFSRLPGLIERPVINDATDPANGFKFSSAKPTVPRVQSKIPLNVFESKILVATGSRSAIEQEADQVESGVRQTASDSLIPKSKSRTSSISSWPRKDSTSLPYEASQGPSSKLEAENRSLHSLPQGPPTPRHRANSHVGVFHTTQSGKAQDAGPVPFGSSQADALHRSKPVLLNKNSRPITSITRNHSEVSQDFTSRQDEQVEQASRIGRYTHVQEERREFDQQPNLLGPLPASATRSGKSVQRKLTSSRFRSMPFPDAALDRPVRPRHRPASSQLMTIAFTQPQERVVSNASFPDAVCNERRTRTPRSDSAQVLGGPKEDHFATGNSNPADTRGIPAKYHEPYATSVSDTSFTGVAHTSMLDMQPHDIAKHTNADEQSVYPPPHSVQDLPTAKNRSHVSPPGNNTELLPQTNDTEDAAQSHSRHGHEIPKNMVEGSDHAIWQTDFDGIPQDELCDPLVSNHTQGASRTVSRAQSVVRPDSRRSNLGRPISRPVRVGDLISRPSSARSSHALAASKVTKVAGQPTRSNNLAAVLAPKGARTFVHDRLMEVRHGLEEVYHSYQEQQDIIAKKNLQIENLEESNAVSQQQTENLAAENNYLTIKINKVTERSSKYKKHMNDVVNNQKFLKDQATQMQKKADEVLQAQKLEEQKQYGILKKIEMAVKEAKDMRGSVEERQNLINENKQLKQKNEELSLVQRQNQRLEEVNGRLHQDNNGFKATLDIETKRLQALQDDYNRKSHDLSCETRNKEQLQKQLESQNTVYQQLVEHLKQLPEAISEQLQKKDGILAGILSAGDGTQSRIEELVSIVSQLKDIEPKVPAALVQLIEDLSSRLENREQDSDADMASLKEATTKVLEEVKETVKQLCLDETTQTQYHDRISKLEKANESLRIEKVARSHEIQSLTQQLEELQRELTDLQDKLKAKEGELAEVRAIPREDPRSNTKIKELEVAKSILDSQLESANQELSKAKDEVKSVREIAARKDQQIKGIEQKFNNIQKTIKAFDDTRVKYIADKENENQKACQELARKAEAQKETLRVKLESKANNALQRYQVKESELLQTKQKLQELQAQLSSQKDSATNQVSEQATLVQDTKEQLARVQQLIERATSQKTVEEFAQELRSITAKARESHVRYGSAKSQLSKILSSATEEQRRIDEKLGKVVALKTELQDLKGKCSVYEKQIAELRGVGTQQQQSLLGAESRRESVNATHNLPPIAADVYSTNSLLQRQGQATPGSIISGLEGMRRSAVQNAQHKAHSRPTITDEMYRRTNAMVSPQPRVSMGIAGSRTTAWQAASQTSETPIRPFSAKTTPSPPHGIDVNRITSAQHEGHRSATGLSKQGPAGPGPSVAQSTHLASTGSTHNSGVNGGTMSQHSQHEGNRNISKTAVFASQVAKQAKTALKHKVNPNLAVESASIETGGRQASKPRETYGLGNIPGIRSGKGAGLSNKTAQHGHEQPTVVPFQGQSSPLPAIARFQGRKRTHDGLASDDARKRTKSMRKLSKPK
ncbi:hypothetical protein VTL71DRAFT_15192 [Oculimacula yallundae]|uniref:Uncharacterized protein n=1 Tax=Oculimacula yallundae TaxID=86028 RepID=A0ABR4CI64_9HELO